MQEVNGKAVRGVDDDKKGDIGDQMQEVRDQLEVANVEALILPAAVAGGVDAGETVLYKEGGGREF